jgi:hypothetical protein
MIKANPNYHLKTFTIRKIENGKTISKFKTPKMNKNEFWQCVYNTENDWKDYLKNNEVTLIK